MSENDFVIHQVTAQDDLDAICAQMQPHLWDEVNDIAAYEPAGLREFLTHSGTLLLAYDKDKIVGVALCYDMPHPASDSHSFYVHELDTHPDYRRRGIASRLMNEAFMVGKSLGAAEIWVATETDNDPANALYKKLEPDEIEPSITYSYKIEAQ